MCVILYYCTMIKFSSKRWLLSLLFILSFVSAHARSYYFEKFSMVDGLPNNTINDIYEDSRGIVWLATNAGLYEFNGKEINFRDDLYKLQGEHVSSLCEDNDGNLLIATLSRGLFKYNGQKLYELKAANQYKGINILYGTKENYFSAISSKKIIEINRQSLVERLIKNEGFQNGRKTLDRIFLFKKSSVGSTIFDDNFNEVEEGKIQSITIGKKRGKFTLLNYSQVILKGKDFSYTCDVLDVYKSKEITFALLRYIEKGIEYRKIVSVSENGVTDFSEKYNLNSYFITSIYVRKGSRDVWIGTKNSGVLCAKKSNFSYFTSQYLTGTNKKIKTFVSDNTGKFFIAFSDEIIVFKDSKVITRIKNNQLCSLLNLCKDCDQKLIIADIRLDFKNRLWVATNKGFFVVEGENIVFKEIAKAEKFVFSKDDEIIYFANGCLKFASTNNKKNEKAPYYFSDSINIELSKILKNGTDIWVATKQQGIVKYSHGKFSTFNRHNSKIHNVVNDLLILPDNSIILGGNNGVIYQLEDHQNRLDLIDSISYKDGLKGTSVHGFQYLKEGYLWCGTNLGVHCFDFNFLRADDSKEPLFWNANEDFSNQEAIKSIIDKNNDIWVLTHNRLIKVDTELTKSNHLNCGLFLKQIDILGKKSNRFEQNPWTRVLKDPIVLNHKQRNLTFHFGIAFCPSPDNLQFRYQLEGFENNWSQWAKSKKAIFTNLKNGEYTLRFQGKELSTGNVFQVSYKIIIVKAWWQKLWFLLLIAFIFAVLICWISRQYAKRVREKENQRTRQFKKILNLKMQALQNQLDPHFIFNSLNSIQSYILEDNSDDALEYLNDFSMVLRKNIDNANKNFIALSDEINYLRNYLKLEQMRFSEHFTYEVISDPEMNLSKLKLPPMFIHPFVENAIRYGLSGVGEEGKLKVYFSEKKKGYLSCFLEDNGIGRDKAWQIQNASNIQDHSKSMEIIDGRINLLNQVVSDNEKFFYRVEDLFDENGKAIGTRVELGFPQII